MPPRSGWTIGSLPGGSGSCTTGVAHTNSKFNIAHDAAGSGTRDLIINHPNVDCANFPSSPPPSDDNWFTAQPSVTAASASTQMDDPFRRPLGRGPCSPRCAAWSGVYTRWATWRSPQRATSPGGTAGARFDQRDHLRLCRVANCDLDWAEIVRARGRVFGVGGARRGCAIGRETARTPKVECSATSRGPINTIPIAKARRPALVSRRAS